jgi:hypothetical protein
MLDNLESEHESAADDYQLPDKKVYASQQAMIKNSSFVRLKHELHRWKDQTVKKHMPSF